MFETVCAQQHDQIVGFNVVLVFSLRADRSNAEMNETMDFGEKVLT